MKLGVCAVAVALAAGGSACAQSADQATLMKPVRQFIDGINKGDMKAAAAVFTSDATIIDEFEPFVWRGPNAFQSWGAAFGEDSKRHGDTGAALQMGATPRIETSGDRAYVMVPARLSFRRAGKPVHEDGSTTFVLTRDARDWKVAAFAWAGPKPQP